MSTSDVMLCHGYVIKYDISEIDLCVDRKVNALCKATLLIHVVIRQILQSAIIAVMDRDGKRVQKFNAEIEYDELVKKHMNNRIQQNNVSQMLLELHMRSEFLLNLCFNRTMDIQLASCVLDDFC